MPQCNVLGNTSFKIGAIRAPTIVIQGREDPFYPLQAANEIASTIPDAELLIVDGMGHSLPREVLERVLDGIAANSSKR